MAPRSTHFQDVCFLHGRGEGANALKKIQELIQRNHKKPTYSTPLLPHADPKVAAETSLEWMERFVPFLTPGMLMIGVNLGGLLAAKIQENHPELDLSVFALVAPTSCDGVRLEKKMNKRVVLYSTAADASIKGHCEDWPEFTDQAFDVSWLMHDIDLARYSIAYLITCYMKGWNIAHQVETLFPAPPIDDNSLYT